LVRDQRAIFLSVAIIAFIYIKLFGARRPDPTRSGDD